MAKDEKKEEPEAPDPPKTVQDVVKEGKKLAKSAGVNTTREMLLVGAAGVGNLVAALTQMLVDGLEGKTEKAEPKRRKKKAPRA